MIKEAIIPLAGLGTRLLPFSKILPKELLPLGNKTILEHILDECLDAGIKKIILVISKKKKIIKDYLYPDPYLIYYLKKKKDNKSIRKLKILERYKNKIKFIYQNFPKGLGDAVLEAKSAIKEKFFLLVLPDDIIIKENCSKKMINIHNKYHSSVIASKKVKNSEISRYGIIKYSKKINNYLIVKSLVEKPSLKSSPSNYAIIGRYILPTKIFSSLQNTKKGSLGEVQITDAMKYLIYNDNKFVAHIFSGTYLDCGTINGYNNSLKKILI
jgi:UTP--glucose-1-phosphate uridylyltransferase